METKILAEEILALAKTQNEAYLIAYRTGYEAGWSAALDHALSIINRPISHKESSNGT